MVKECITELPVILHLELVLPNVRNQSLNYYIKPNTRKMDLLVVVVPSSPPQLCAVHAMRHKSPGMFIR